MMVLIKRRGRNSSSLVFGLDYLSSLIVAFLVSTSEKALATSSSLLQDSS